MKTEKDIRMLYQHETGIYPIIDCRGNIDDPDYSHWLEENAVKAIQGMRKTVSEKQQDILNHGPVGPWVPKLGR